MESCDDIACKPIKIPNTELELPHFKCVLGDCDECGKYKAPELELTSDTQVSYCLFTNFIKCNVHGADCIETYNETPTKKKLRCTKCQSMKPSEATKWKRKGKAPKIQKKKLRSKHVMPMKEFMAPGGMYEKQLKKMLYHKAHVKLLGKMHMIPSRKQEAESKNCVEFQRDHAERYTPVAPNGQIQSEYYGQDVSISMEGSTATFKPLPDNKEGLDSTCHRVEFFSHLSNDKRQDGNTVYTNIRFTLNKLLQRGMIKRKTLDIVMDIVDGCGVQYRCGTVLYFLAKLAFDYDIIYDRAVQAPGHGKCIVDALNGIDKTVLSKAIQCKTAIVKSQRNQLANAQTMGLHQVDETGERVDAALWAYNELSSGTRQCGV